MAYLKEFELLLPFMKSVDRALEGDVPVSVYVSNEVLFIDTPGEDFDTEIRFASAWANAAESDTKDVSGRISGSSSREEAAGKISKLNARCNLDFVFIESGAVGKFKLFHPISELASLVICIVCEEESAIDDIKAVGDSNFWRQELGEYCHADAIPELVDWIRWYE